MLRSLGGIIGYRLEATDGEIGTVMDFYFDDGEWKVRYLAADTGKWLPGRKVLIAPQALGPPDWQSGLLPVSLSTEEIKNSPGIASDEPVSRQKEMELADHFDWAPYWPQPALGADVSTPAGPGFWPQPASGSDVTTPEGAGSQVPMPGGAKSRTGGAKQDPGLRSFQEVKGYSINASDGEFGHVDDMIVDTSNQTIRYLVIDTRKWIPGRKVLIAPSWVRDVDWTERLLSVDHSRDEIESSPEYDPAEPVNRTYEEHLYDYYGRPRYW